MVLPPAGSAVHGRVPAEAVARVVRRCPNSIDTASIRSSGASPSGSNTRTAASTQPTSRGPITRSPTVTHGSHGCLVQTSDTRRANSSACSRHVPTSASGPGGSSTAASIMIASSSSLLAT